jgi:hypothetical protein
VRSITGEVLLRALQNVESAKLGLARRLEREAQQLAAARNAALLNYMG